MASSGELSSTQVGRMQCALLQTAMIICAQCELICQAPAGRGRKWRGVHPSRQDAVLVILLPSLVILGAASRW